MTPTWRPNPLWGDSTSECDVLATDEQFAAGECVGQIEDYGYACYARAFSAAHDRWERGGPQDNRVAARLWAERVAGLHPTKIGDERPAFYYDPSAAE